MKILYIFPHPDDESYGAAHLMKKQLKDGHQVYLLTLTKGGATKVRLKLNLSVEEMGEIRYNELKDAAGVIGLTGLTVLDLPDSQLKEADPRVLEKVIEHEISTIKPEVIVSYAVHGISGFHDHLITHAAVKRVFVELKEKTSFLKRYAMMTITEETAARSAHFKLNFSKPEEIDCVEITSDDDLETAKRALDCYKTYKETIDNSGIKNLLTKEVYFELFMESFSPPVNNLFAELDK